MTGRSVLSLRNVEKAYGSIAALSQINLDVYEGEIMGLLGSNGSGKTTLLKIVAMLVAQDRGRIAYFGRRGTSMRSAILHRIGVLFDHASHWDSLSGYENAWFFARSYGLTRSNATERLDRLFQRFGLAERQDDPVSSYSFGMRRKLSLIEAMAHRPSLLLLDEPTIGLDYRARMALHDLLAEEADNGTAAMLCTNDVHEAAAVARRVALFDRGRILACEDPRTLIASVGTGSRIELRLASAIPPSTLGNIPGVQGVHIDVGDGGLFHAVILAARDSSEIGGLLADIVQAAGSHQSRILGIEVTEPDLGDVFLKYVREERNVS